ncbi:hypothetical protein FQA39_LY08927 [Lamprigera yunnana]|nr:hypothetical protein FQA39_LY08927 [Lamprigera yunnana]
MGEQHPTLYLVNKLFTFFVSTSPFGNVENIILSKSGYSVFDHVLFSYYKIKNTDNDVTGSPNSGKVERIRISDSQEKTTEQPEPSFFPTASKSCLKSDLAMMLDSSSEDGSQEETSDNSDPGAILKKELLQYRNKKRINVSENPLNW